MSETQAVRTVADGSSADDAPDPVVVDRDEEPYRWACPNGHVRWDKTNSHIWCQSCRNQLETGEDVTPEHYEIVDKLEERTVPWSAVVLVE